MRTEIYLRDARSGPRRSTGRQGLEGSPSSVSRATTWKFPQEGAEDAGDGIGLPPEASAETAASLNIPAHLLTKLGEGLVSLDVTALEMDLQTANMLNDALRNNCTIEELAASDNLLVSCSFGEMSTSFRAIPGEEQADAPNATT
ncbi:hypothetical protein MRX96_039366 [Rhipicephalus microplus]